MRLLRGQVVVREDMTPHDRAGRIIIPAVSNSDEKHAVSRRRDWHVGEGIAMGPPAQTKRGADVPHGFTVGDRVLFHWVHNEANFTLPWIDGQPACWVPQEAIDGVIE